MINSFYKCSYRTPDLVGVAANVRSCCYYNDVWILVWPFKAEHIYKYVRAHSLWRWNESGVQRNVMVYPFFHCGNSVGVASGDNSHGDVLYRPERQFFK